jgi:hypothetical protein
VNKPSSGNRHKFKALIHECEIHVKRIIQAQSKARTLFPLSPDTYSTLTDDAVEHIDQLVYRFTKLQDALGAKLFPLIVSILREDSKTLTIYDVLNELEKREAIPSAESWMVLREIRNQIAHDYENDPEMGSHYLNEIFDKADEIVHISEQVIGFTREYILPSLPDSVD